MKRITNSFIKNIVRQSLNESYGLLNEDLQEVEPYSIKTSVKHGTVPKGTSVYNMTYEKCPEGGICFEFLSQAKEDAKNLSGKDLINRWCSQTYMANAMGKPTKSGTVLTNVTTPLFAQLTEFGMNYGTITTKLKDLGDFPTFCVANKKFKTYGGGDYSLGIAGTSETTGSDYGIENDHEGERAEYYAITDGLFENSIAVSDEFYETWKKQLEEKYKATLDAADKIKKDEENKKNIQAKIIGGGGEYIKWVQEHPALINKSEIITTDRGDANLYSLNTGDPIIDQYQYGVLLIVDPKNPSMDGTYEDIRVKKGTNIALSIDPTTDKFWQFAISQNDVWRYDDVAWSGAFSSIQGKLALTTNPDLEDDGTINQSIQTERTKGFRHNLLTEIELKLWDRGPEVGKIQSKLKLKPDKGTPIYGPDTKAAVEKFQTENGITPVTGNIDANTYDKILEKFPDPKPASATEYTRDLNIGSTGPDVEAIQKKLKLKPGKYGTDTQTAVMNYQKKYTDLNDQATGIVDKETFDHIMANTKLDTPISYSGRKHNYKKGDWIAVKPNSGNQASQLYENNGYFKILEAPDSYTIIIDAVWPWDTKGYSIVGGTTAKIIFGPDSMGGAKTIPTVSDNSSNTKEKGTKNNTSNSGNNSGTNTIDSEKQRQRDIRNKEFCDTLREIKKYLNNTKSANLPVNCQRTPETKNQIMLALTGGTPAPAPTQDTGVNVQSVPVTDTLF